jgi:hypothetical protein
LGQLVGQAGLGLLQTIPILGSQKPEQQSEFWPQLDPFGLQTSGGGGGGLVHPLPPVHKAPHSLVFPHSIPAQLLLQSGI